MKNKESLLYAGLAAALVCGVAVVVIIRDQGKRDAGLQAAHTRHKTAATDAKLKAKTAPLPVPGADVPRSASTSRGSRPTKPAAMDPAARTALAFVGIDSASEQYWIGAINNPFLPAHERSDLIEDLNEDGLSDPKHPGANDLPLIRSRLQLIEQLMPNAMDLVNAAAFREAHKDLTNMVSRLTRQ